MPNAKLLVTLFASVLVLPAPAIAGLNVYRADGPPPKIEIEVPKPLEYKVAKGDTIATIAKKFSVDSKTLLAANKMANARKLKIGQVLTIPGKTQPTPQPQAVAKTAPQPTGKPAPTAPASEAKPLAATAAPAGVTQQAIAQPVKSEPDAIARKAARRGEILDPGVVEEKPAKGKRGKRRGKEELAPPVAPPPVVIDEKTRQSFGKAGVIMNSSDVPQDIREGFWRYAQSWVDELDRIGVGTFANKKIKQVDGQWEASYRVILRESLGAEVKRVEYEHTPYVGHITYVQKVFTCTAPTKEAALRGPFTEKNESIREIFSYSAQKKAWR